MTTTAKMRLMKDLKVLKSQQDNSIYAMPFEDDIMIWCGIIFGPKETIFEGGTFSLIIKFKDSYPNSPPEIKFISNVFHPNVYPNGDLCLDLLKNRWSPTYDVYGVLVSVQSLLSDPNVNSPANIEAAEMYKNNPEAYKERVIECVEKSWNDIN